MAGIVKRKLAGSVMWEPYISLAQYHGIGQVLFQEGMGEDYLTGIVADENWARHHEGDAVAYLKAHLRVHTFIRNDPDAAAELISRAKEFLEKLQHELSPKSDGMLLFIRKICKC